MHWRGLGLTVSGGLVHTANLSARVGHHPATLIPFPQPSPTSDLPAEGHYCRKTRRSLTSKQRIKGGILTDCRHLRLYCVWLPPCCFTTGVSGGTRENVSTAGCNFRPFTLHQENGQGMRWCYCSSLPSPVLLRPGTGLHGSGRGARVRGCGADRRSMCPRLHRGFMVAKGWFWAQGSWCPRQRKTPAALCENDDHRSL